MVTHPVVKEELLRAMCHPEVFKRLPKGGVRMLKVTHTRDRKSIKKWSQKYVVTAKGGSTIVSLNIYGDEFVGGAVCIEQDGFCKKTGRELAFLRAVEKYWKSLETRR